MRRLALLLLLVAGCDGRHPALPSQPAGGRVMLENQTG